MIDLDPEKFQQVVQGKQTGLYFLRNSKGLEAAVSNYGARLIALVFNGVNVTPAYRELAPYLSPTLAPYHGATVGRYANRIAKGIFSVDGKTYTLATNNGANHLHGGPMGFHNQVWDVGRVTENEIEMTCVSPDGEEGYPGTVTVTVTYTLTDADEWQVSYRAETNAPTPFNVTNHAFFNLNGGGNSR